MITVHHTRPSAVPYWVIMFFLFLILGKYALETVEWIIMKLYEFFIQDTPITIA